MLRNFEHFFGALGHQAQKGSHEAQNVLQRYPGSFRRPQEVSKRTPHRGQEAPRTPQKSL